MTVNQTGNQFVFPNKQDPSDPRNLEALERWLNSHVVTNITNPSSSVPVQGRAGTGAVTTAGGGGYKSLTGPGQTATPGKLTQQGGFAINNVTDATGVSVTDSSASGIDLTETTNTTSSFNISSSGLTSGNLNVKVLSNDVADLLLAALGGQFTAHPGTGVVEALGVSGAGTSLSPDEGFVTISCNTAVSQFTWQFSCFDPPSAGGSSGPYSGAFSLPLIDSSGASLNLFAASNLAAMTGVGYPGDFALLKTGHLAWNSAGTWTVLV